MSSRLLRSVLCFLVLGSGSVYGYISPRPLGGPVPTSHIKFDSKGNPYYLAGTNIVTPNGQYPFLSPGGTPLIVTAFAVRPDGTYVLTANNQIMDVAESGLITVIASVTLTPRDMTLDSAGNIYLTGPPVGSNPSFVFALRPDGTHIYSETGYGGSQITVDVTGNVYTVGVQDFQSGTPGSLQPEFHHASRCIFSEFSGQQTTFADGCVTQDVVAVNPDGRVIFATFLGGSQSELPAGISVDAGGNIYVAGTTDSADYPVTAGALQTQSRASVPQPNSHFPFGAPSAIGWWLSPPTGYVSALNPTGTALVFSTYFGGSVDDAITSVLVTPQFGVLLAGRTNSPDFPGLQGGASRCVPATFLAAISPDGTLEPTQTAIPFSTQVLSFTGLAVPRASPVLMDGTNLLLASPPDQPPLQISCFVNSSNLVLTSTVVPGQLLTLFGNNLAQGVQVVQPVDGSYPTFAQGLTVTFDGFPAPLLYVSPDQVNLQVPFEVAYYPSVVMEFTKGAQYDQPQLTATYFPVVPISPTTFAIPLEPGECPGEVLGQTKTLAINEDGTINGCTNPAPPGSTVKLFVNGVGQTLPGLLTGAVTSANPEDSPVKITHFFPGEPASEALVPLSNAITGVYSFTVPMPDVQGFTSILIASEICLGAIDISGNPICFGANSSVYVGPLGVTSHAQPFERRDVRRVQERLGLLQR